MEFRDRSHQILVAVVNLYIREGTPVGSRTLTEHIEFGLSSATIRVIMAELEEMGFLSQPHTSAGRIPTEKGYRHYVDGLISGKKVAGILLEQVGAMLEPGVQLADRDAVQDVVQAPQEGRDRIGCDNHQCVAEVQDVALRPLRHLAKCLGAVGKESGSGPKRA